MNSRKLYVFGVATLLLLVMLAPAALAQESTPTAENALIEVEDQDIVDGTVTIDRVVSPGPGWVVIHVMDDDSPGAVIGFEQVDEGENTNVTVEIDQTQATETLSAMLHMDAGTVGTFEFPGADAPVSVEGEVVNEVFRVTGGLQVTPGITATVEVSPTVAATATVSPTVGAEATATVSPTVGVGATPGTLPTTGGAPMPWALVVLALGGLLLVGGLGLALARRS